MIDKSQCSGRLVIANEKIRGALFFVKLGRDDLPADNFFLQFFDERQNVKLGLHGGNIDLPEFGGNFEGLMAWPLIKSSRLLPPYYFIFGLSIFAGRTF